MNKTDLIKVIIKYLSVQRTPIKDGLWQRNIKSTMENETEVHFVTGNTIDIIAAMIEDKELIRWSLGEHEGSELRYAKEEGNSTITFLEEKAIVYLEKSDIPLKVENGRLFHDPSPVKRYPELDIIRTANGFLQYAEMMDDIDKPMDLVADIFGQEKKKDSEQNEEIKEE